MKPLFVIMVTYRRLPEFKRTVESLLPTLPYGSKLAIVVNGNVTYEEHEYLEDLEKRITALGAVKIETLLTGDNRGWGASMNEGLALYSDWKEYEYILESNNDVEYEPDWFPQAQSIMRKDGRDIGILGLWSHPHHGIRGMTADIVVKDNMPACAWLFKSRDLAKFLPFKEAGPCATRGGNGEDTDMVLKVQDMGFLVCGSIPDLAHHIDGYDIPDLGKVNPAYL